MTHQQIAERAIFDHRVDRVSEKGHVYCHCSKFHPFQGLWAHSCHVATVLIQALAVAA